MKYIYGPVKSRRLGNSLGLSLTPYKVCNFDCLYCQLGKTTERQNQRKEFVKAEDILAELRSWIANNPKDAQELDFITFSGFGEPTLNSKAAYLIQEIKKISPAKIAIITNSSLMLDVSVRTDLLGADLIVPSLDAGTQEIFEKIDRPYPGIKLEDIIEGLIALRKEFKGKIWLEVMLVRGINDDLKQIKKLKEAIDRINPDRVQINSPVRSTAEKCILPVEKPALEKIKEIFGVKAEII